ncbi:hypothetical protein RP20_CCG005593 [Aedes albopictus]|nr:hypothetical protein RP20_CCG005593 [Aedes albopictus]
MKLILVVTNWVGKIPHRHKWGHTLLLLSSDPTPHQTSTAVPLSNTQKSRTPDRKPAPGLVLASQSQSQEPRRPRAR